MTRIVLSLVIALIAADASACGRCGIFGRGCRFAAPVHHAPVYHAPAIVKAPDNLQTFIFNNIAPVGDLAPRGATVYGLSRALEYNSPNSALYLNNASRAFDVASEFTAAARSLDSEVLQAATIDAQGRAVEAAFRALKPDVTARSTSTTTRITLRNGLPVFDERQQVPPEEPQPVPRQFAGGLSCLRCHAVDGEASKKFVIDDTFGMEDFLKAKRAIDDGVMPPKSNLTEVERASLIVSLGRLVPNQ